MKYKELASSLEVYKGWSIYIDYTGFFSDEVTIVGCSQTIINAIIEANKATIFASWYGPNNSSNFGFGIESHSDFQLGLFLMSKANGLPTPTFSGVSLLESTYNCIYNELKKKFDFEISIPKFSVSKLKGGAITKAHERIDQLGDLLTYARGHGYVK